MHAGRNTTIGVLAGLLLGLVAGLSIEQIGMDVVQRRGWAKWFFDWQQLLSAIIALAAAGVTVRLLWEQIRDTKRQAVAAERQAALVTADSLKRHIAAVDALKFDIGSLNNRIGSIELFRVSGQMEELRGIISRMADRVNTIRHAARQHGLSSEATSAVENYCRLALKWGNVARRLEDKELVRPRVGGGDQMQLQQEIQQLAQAASAIREELLKADLAALRRIDQDIAPLREREAELRTILWR